MPASFFSKILVRLCGKANGRLKFKSQQPDKPEKSVRRQKNGFQPEPRARATGDNAHDKNVCFACVQRSRKTTHHLQVGV